MKRTIALTALIMLLCVATAPAQNWPFLKNAQPYTTLTTLVSATTATGSTGAVLALGIPFERITCLVTNPAGSVPTNAVVRLSGGLDGTNLITLTTQTITSMPALFTTNAAAALSVTHLRGTYANRTGGSATTQIQMDCMAAH